jgi:hypothetical protein
VKGRPPEIVDGMYDAWWKSMILQATLWVQPYMREGDYRRGQRMLQSVTGLTRTENKFAGPIAEAVMPIAQFLEGSEFDPETKRVIRVAFEMTRVALRYGDQGDLSETLGTTVARRLIELARSSELNPDRLCESVLSEFRQHF